MANWDRKREVLNLTLGISASNTQRARDMVQNKAELGMTQRGTEDASPSWDMVRSTPSVILKYQQSAGNRILKFTCEVKG